MDQSILRGDLSTEFARRERAERFLRVRAALRAEAARSATIDVLRRHWWWPWSLLRNAPQNPLEHLPGDGDPGHLEGNIAPEQSKNSVHHQPQDREGARPDYPARANGPARLAASTASNAGPSNQPRPPKEDKICLVADHARR